MKVTSRFLAAILISVAAFGQRPEFEVASIKPSAPPSGGQVNVGVHIDGASVRCAYLSINDYIGMAYKVKAHQIDGPAWLASDRFDIAARLPAGAKGDQVPEMMQALLADRFGLKMHRASKEVPVYGLLLGKGGLKIKEAAGSSEVDQKTPVDAKAPVDVKASGSAAGTVIDFGNGSSFTFGNNRLEAKKLTMAGLADTLSRFSDRPVVDMTELKGSYDWVLEVSPDDFRAMQIRGAMAAGVVLPPQVLAHLEHASGDSLHTALDTLGLKMEPRKAPIETLVIDHAEKTPTAN